MNKRLIATLLVAVTIGGIMFLAPTRVQGDDEEEGWAAWGWDLLRRPLLDAGLRTVLPGPLGPGYEALRAVQNTGAVPALGETITDALGATANIFGQPIIKALQAIIYLIVYVLGFIVALGIALLDLVLAISKFSTNNIVIAGWEFTRDALNFMFILAILVVAFAEIAGISGWNIRALLPRLLIAALLVNFSLAISGAFVDFSRVLMSGLTGDATDVGSALVTGENGILKASVVDKYFSVRPDKLFSGFFGLDHNVVWVGWVTLAELVISLFGIILATATIFVSALFLLIRAIGLWILLILSPVGFVFTILPQTRPWAEKWWSAFIRYVMYGPVFVFFLALSGRVGSAVSDRDSLFENLFLPNTQPAGEGINFLFDNELMFFVFQSMFFAIFIFGGLIATQQMGIHLGGKAAGMVTGLTGLGLKGVREGTGAGYVGRRVKAGWEAVSAERKREAELKQRTSIPGQIGAFARAPFSGETRERAMQRSAAERAKQMDESGMDGESAIAGMNDPGKTMVERRASALHAVKLNALDEPKDYQTALELLKGTKEHANVQRNYQRTHPMLERAGATKLSEVTGKLNALKASNPTKHASVIKGIQDDVRKAKSDQARDWSGDTIQVMVDNKIHPGSSNVRTIMREGSPEARAKLQSNKGKLEDHEKTMLASEGGGGESQQTQSQGSGI